MKRLAIIGSGDLGQQIAYHAKADGHYEPVGFFDDYQVKGSLRHNLPVLGGTDSMIDSYNQGNFDVIMIGVGYLHMKKRAEFFEQLKGQIPFGKIIHSSSYIDVGSKIGDGVFIYPRCILDQGVVIEDNVLINIGCTIAHDSRVGQNSFLSPSVSIAGFVDINKNVSLGIGTIVIDNIKINSNVKTGGGAVVIDNIVEEGLYVGMPAKLKKS